jgi:hypothetical protein
MNLEFFDPREEHLPAATSVWGQLYRLALHLSILAATIISGWVWVTSLHDLFCANGEAAWSELSILARVLAALLAWLGPACAIVSGVKIPELLD